MSAFDIAGAVVATPLAVLMWTLFLYGLLNEPEETKTISFCFLWGGIATAWAAFCIARLCGAGL